MRQGPLSWVWDWTNAVTTGDQAAEAELATAVAATVAAVGGTGFERAATVIAEPLLQTINAEGPSTENDYTTECPDWTLKSGPRDDCWPPCSLTSNSFFSSGPAPNAVWYPSDNPGHRGARSRRIAGEVLDAPARSTQRRVHDAGSRCRCTGR